MTHQTRDRRAAFTLTELTVSMLVMTVLLGALASAIALASRALPDSSSELAAVSDAARAAEQLSGELFNAVTVGERLPNSVSFTVADRDGDSSPESIRYAWSGTAGDPLTREYNAGPAVNVIDHLYDFTLTYTTKTVSETTTQVTQQPETLLASFEGWAGVVPTPVPLSSSRWLGEYFTFTIPPDATTLDITRIELMLKEDTADPTATVSVGIHAPITSGEPIPQSTPIGTPSVRLTSTFSNSLTWESFTLSDVSFATPAQEYVVVVKGTTAGTASSRYQYLRRAPADNTSVAMTSDGGASWTPTKNYDDYDMETRVWGVFGPSTTQETTVTRYYLNGVKISLNAGSDAAARVTATARVINEPEVPGA